MELLTCFTRVGSRNMSHFRAGVFWVSFWIYGGGGVVSGVDEERDRECGWEFICSNAAHLVFSKSVMLSYLDDDDNGGSLKNPPPPTPYSFFPLFPVLLFAFWL